MVVSPDIISEIQNYHPMEKGSIGQTVELGSVGDEYFLRWGLQHIQRRAEHLSGEPKIAGEFTTQPGLCLSLIRSDGREIRRSLIYRSEIEGLGDNLATRVWYAVVTAKCLQI